MFGRNSSSPGRKDDDLPTEIYTAFVESLFRDPRTLLIGALGSTSAALITAWKAGEPLLLVCAAAMALLACARSADVRNFAREKATVTTREAARKWELRYVVGASAYVILLGAWCLIAFAKTDDPFVQLLSFSMILVNMIGVAGRNFGSPLLVNAQLICAGIPMILGLFIMGGPYYTVFGCVLIPFFISMKGIADRLRRTLQEAVLATRDVTLLAGRFDTALNNMPHGLCMFDADGCIVVANSRLAEHLRLPANAAGRGVPARDLLQRCIEAGTFPALRLESLVAEFESRLAGEPGDELLLATEDGRTLSVKFQPMENRGSVVLVEDITERKSAEAKINHLAHYDPLTGLPNRMFFHHQIGWTLASMDRNSLCAVLFVDLDQFKQVNDTLGHPCGDALLCAVADRLRSLVRDIDVVARFGGDEFVVLQKSVRRPEDAALLARRIVERLAGSYEVEGHQVVIGASIGIALAPKDGATADLLLKNADMALYRAKSEGRGAWRFFEPEMDVKAQARRSLELELRKALASDALDVYYQPLINLRTHRISSCEALLRWPHPERGMISPAEFIPVAEEMGLIVEIGNWVLRRACLECAHWPDGVRIAVNLSPIQFKRGNVVERIKQCLEEAGLPPSRLEIEITESVLMQDTDGTRACLDELRRLGIGISLDDFGTGYSSLSYLHNFPLNKVKIDRSFLKGIASGDRSPTLLRSVARLSAELGMAVTMEGIETEEQLAFITREQSITEAQGFLFSPAIPSRQIRPLLEATSAETAVRHGRAQKVA